MTALFLLVLITLPFGAKFLVYQFTPGFHEYETAFVYLNDIALILFLVVFAIQKSGLIRGGNFQFPISPPKADPPPADNFQIKPKSQKLKPQLPVTSYLLLVTFLFFSAFSIFSAPSKGLATYAFARLFVYVLFVFAAARILTDRKIFRRALAVLALLAVVQSLIGIWQFKMQDDLSLQFLGESPIGALDSGTSKVLLGGLRFVRAYGTFPHPNILAAFLTVGLVALFHFWLKRPSEWKFFSGWRTVLSDVILGVGIFLVSIGLVFTFSRTGWAIALAVTVFTAVYTIIKRDWFIQGVRLAVLSIAILGILAFNFGGYIFPRAQISRAEPAVTQRLEYNKLAFEIIKEKPFGVGMGNQVLYSVKNGLYQRMGMSEVWQWQPIHNLYLLIASEIGILGLLAFLVFLITLFLNPKFKILNSKQILNSNVQNSKRFRISDFPPKADPPLAEEFRISAAILLSLLLMAAADHFLWTLPQGQLMLWLAIGLMISRAHSSTDPEPKQVLGRGKQKDPSLPREMSS